MRYSHLIINRARILRSEGASFDIIRNKIGIQIPKATLSHWCRGIPLPEKQVESNKLAQLAHLHRARLLSVEQKCTDSENQLKRITKQSRTIVAKLQTKEACLLALAMLYLGEGAKAKGHSGLLLGSSDPNIIQLYIMLLEQCYSLTVNDLRCRISYRADQDIHELQQYWSAVTGIPLIHFYKTTPDQRTVGKPTKRVEYRGVCVISCRGRIHQLELQQVSNEYLKLLKGL